MPIFVNASFLAIYPMTGLSRYALAMSLGMQEIFGDQVVFLAPRRAHPIPQLAQLNIEYIGPDRKWLLWEQYDLPAYLSRNGNPLLVNFGNTAPVFYKNKIVTILDVFYHHVEQIVGEEQSAYPWRDIKFYKLITKQIAIRSKHVLTISDYSKKDIAQTLGINYTKIDVVYPTVSDFFLSDCTYQYDNNAIKGDYILGVSSVTPHKNFSSLIKAFQLAELPNTRLVIVGNMPPTSIFNSFADNNIEFTGYIDDHHLKSLYKKARFFAYPSKFEGFGIPPLEAMACGCPTLVANVASMPEVCGPASYYVDPYSVDDIANGLTKLNTDSFLREQLTVDGFKQLPLYDKSVSTNRLATLIDKYRN